MACRHNLFPCKSVAAETRARLSGNCSRSVTSGELTTFASSTYDTTVRTNSRGQAPPLFTVLPVFSRVPALLPAARLCLGFKRLFGSLVVSTVVTTRLPGVLRTVQFARG